MPKGLSFPKDTRDVIERLFADRVLENFPNYGKFWEEFIGRRLDATPALRPYGLTFSSFFDPDTESRIEKAYDRLVATHHRLFCELAGAHYQVSQAREASTKIALEQRHLFWESFGNLYQHLGNARNSLRGLWQEMKIITGTYERLETYLAKSGQQDLRDQLEVIEKEIVAIRNNLVHHLRMSYVRVQDVHLVPLPIENDQEPLVEPKEAMSALTKMKDDLFKYERLLNEIESSLSRFLATFFVESGITVNKV